MMEWSKKEQHNSVLTKLTGQPVWYCCCSLLSCIIQESPNQISYESALVKNLRKINGFCNQTRKKEENFYLAGKKKQYETYGEEVAFFVIWLITSLLLDEKKHMMATKLKLSNMFWTVVLLVVSLVSLPMPGKQGNFHVRVHNTYQ